MSHRRSLTLLGIPLALAVALIACGSDPPDATTNTPHTFVLTEWSVAPPAGASVVAIAPDSAEGVKRFVRDTDYSFQLLADIDHTVFDAYDVISKLSSLGQRPALFVVDQTGVVRFDSIGTHQWEIPSNDNVLAVLASI